MRFLPLTGLGKTGGLTGGCSCARAGLDNVGDDCPVFDGLFEYCSISAGGSMGAFRPVHSFFVSSEER